MKVIKRKTVRIYPTRKTLLLLHHPPFSWFILWHCTFSNLPIPFKPLSTTGIINIVCYSFYIYCWLYYLLKVLIILYRVLLAVGYIKRKLCQTAVVRRPEGVLANFFHTHHYHQTLCFLSMNPFNPLGQERAIFKLVIFRIY